MVAAALEGALPAGPAAPPVAAAHELSARELEVARLVADGLSNPAIATDLFVSVATVKTHVSNCLAKLHLRDRVQAVVFAYETGLIRPTETAGPPPG